MQVDADTFRAAGKPRSRLNTKRTTEVLPDGSTRLVTEEMSADDGVWGGEDE